MPGITLIGPGAIGGLVAARLCQDPDNDVSVAARTAFQKLTLEGTAEFHLDGQTRTGGPMTSFYCPSGIAHGIRNIGDTELKYLVIKQYILDD